MNELEKAKEFVREVKEMAKVRGLNCFVVTDGAFEVNINIGNSEVKNARDGQNRLGKENGFDLDEDLSK